MANDDCKCEGYRNCYSEVRVAVRVPGVGWDKPASFIMNEIECVRLIKAINEALAEAYSMSAE